MSTRPCSASPKAEQLAHEEHRFDLGEARARFGDEISDELLLLRMMLPADQVDAMLARRAPSAPRAARGTRRRRSSRASRSATAARDRASTAPGVRRARPMSLLTDIDAVVFDVDGTLLHANDPSGRRERTRSRVPPRPSRGCARAAAACSSSPTAPAARRRSTRPTSAALGFVIADEEFMNPAVVAARWIARRHPGKSVLVLGGPGVVAPLRDLGIETIEAPSRAVADIVLVGWDDVLTYAALRAACESIWAGAPLLATSTASVFSVNGGAAPGWSGAVAAGIRQTTGARALTLGKPSPVALREACRVLGSQAGAHARRGRRPRARDRDGPPRRSPLGARPDRRRHRGSGGGAPARTAARRHPGGRHGAPDLGS